MSPLFRCVKIFYGRLVFAELMLIQSPVPDHEVAVTVQGQRVNVEVAALPTACAGEVANV